MIGQKTWLRVTSNGARKNLSRGRELQVENTITKSSPGYWPNPFPNLQSKLEQAYKVFFGEPCSCMRFMPNLKRNY